VVTLTHRSVVIRPAVAGHEVDEPEVRIEGGGIPDRRPATLRVIGPRRPGVAPELAGPRQREPAPQHLAALGVESGEAAAHAELSSGDAAIDDAVVVERRAGDGVAVLPLLDGNFPRHLARLHVQGNDVGIELAEEELALAHGQPTVDPSAANGRDLLIDAGPVLPEDLAGLRVQRKD